MPTAQVRPRSLSPCRKGAEIGVDLVKDPSKALELPIAVQILFVGIELGSFTGKALND